MRAVVGRLQDTPYVLKGGTALMLTRDLDRHSVDLDFDAERAVNIEERIRDGVKDAGFDVLALTVAKETGTVQRFKLHYDNPETGDTLLKIETSFRSPPAAADVETVDGIRTYRVGAITDQKLTAAEARTAPRDLFDLAHVALRYGDQLSNDQVARLDALSRDFGALAERYGDAFSRDAVLQARTTVDDTVLALREAVEHQMAARGLDGIEAAVDGDLERPTLYVVAGSNGAGKSTLTASGRFGDTRIIDPDAIAKQMAPEDPASAAVGAGRQAVDDRRAALASGQSVVIETTLSGAAALRMMDEARTAGFRVELHHIGLKDADQAVERVAIRVAEGGHDVPEEDIRRRFDRSKDSLPEAVGKADQTTLYDNSTGERHRIAAELTPDAYRFGAEAPAWATEAAYQAAGRDHDRATTVAEADRSFARALEAAEAQGVDAKVIERAREEGLERPEGREVPARSRRSRDDGHSL